MSTQFAPQACRPREILAAVGRAYPNAWRQVDEIRAQRGKGLPGWPDWCFLPLHGAYAIVSGGGDNRVSIERSHHTGILGALATWRVSQGIYRFDPVLYGALVDSALSGTLPCAPLYRLPQWCVYVETPDHTVWNRRLHGFWAHLDWSEGHADELRLVLDLAERTDDPLDSVSGLVPVPIILGEGPLEAALERVAESGAAQARANGYAITQETLAPLLDSADQLRPLISLLLYLCADDKDIGEAARRPANPEPKRTKNGWRMFPADRPTTWEVGVRLGAALRRAYHAAETGAPRPHVAPRAHIRGAHWHGFWRGPKHAPELRTFDVRWLPPIAVNVADLDALPAVVRHVISQSED